MANQDTDIVPGVGATPAQSTASKDLGDELDVIATYQLSPRTQLLMGWSHFWAGNKITPANRQDADFFLHGMDGQLLEPAGLHQRRLHMPIVLVAVIGRLFTAEDHAPCRRHRRHSACSGER